MDFDPDEVEIIDVQDEAALLEILNSVYPDRRIPAHEFHNLIDSIGEIDLNILKYELGTGRTWYSTFELARLLWKLRGLNYDGTEDD